jgi:hypothetical protein
VLERSIIGALIMLRELLVNVRSREQTASCTPASYLQWGRNTSPWNRLLWNVY